MVVEDVPSNQTVLGALLEKTGMNADFAATAAEARVLVRQRGYDFAFVDIQLPDASGTEGPNSAGLRSGSHPTALSCRLFPRAAAFLRSTERSVAAIVR